MDIQVGTQVKLNSHGLHTIDGLSTMEEAEAFREVHTVTEVWFPNPNDHSWCGLSISGPFNMYLLSSDDVDIVP